MARYASKVVEKAQSWLGRNEAAGTHKEIIDIYNNHRPLARNYKVKYTDAWCATFVSATAISLGYTDVIPTECGCEQQIKLFKIMGCWQEKDSHVPAPGDIIYYDWQDSGVGDCVGYSDHVGVVEKVSGGIITVIEGNYKDSVCRRYIKVNAQFIRGYGVPRYDSKVTTDTPVFSDGTDKTITVTLYQKGSIVAEVKGIQKKLIYLGYSCGSCGADGEFGNDTLAAVKAFQKDQKLVVDGIVGEKTSTALNVAYEVKKNNQTKEPDKTEVLFKGKVVTKGSPLNVRTWAGEDYGNISTYPRLANGTEDIEVMNYTQKANDGSEWYYIRYKGKYGFVHSDYIKKM